MRCLRLSGPRYGSLAGAACSRVICRAHQSIGVIGSRSARRSGASSSTARRNRSSSVVVQGMGGAGNRRAGRFYQEGSCK